MKSDLVSDIREHLRRYLASEISLDEFRDWFDVETWDIIDKCPAVTQQFVGEIELRIAEFTNGHRTEDDLRAVLQPLLQREPAAKRG